jgi:hypothetical protein
MMPPQGRPEGLTMGDAALIKKLGVNPKGSSKVPTDLSRDVFWEALGYLGLRPVTQVSVDDVWSALRFRPVAEVGSRRAGVD